MPEYTFEVVEKTRPLSPHGEYRHVGYMQALFRTKRAAAEYYALRNPAMARITSKTSWASDVNKEGLRYIVRIRHKGLEQTVPPFSTADGPRVSETSGATVVELFYLPAVNCTQPF